MCTKSRSFKQFQTISNNFKQFQTIIALFLLIFTIQGANAQVTADTLGYDTLYYQSPQRIQPEAQAVVRLANTADIYLKWAILPGTSNYTVRYKTGEETAAWSTVTTASNELVLENMPLDALILAQIIIAGEPGTFLYESAVMRIKTTAQQEPIEVSPKMYNYLEGWFSKEGNTQSFCEFINALGLNRYEKLAFLQAYAFDNAKFIKPLSVNNSTLSSWFPPTAVTGTGTGDWCLVEPGNCHCKVITRGTNIATPNDKMENYTVFPKKVKTSQRYRVEAGAAKFVSLSQDRTGGQMLEMSSVPGSSYNNGVTAEASEIQFMLACLNGTALPEACQCERPLHIYYEYTTRLHARANVKSCIWSKGAEATAEDMALIGMYEGKTGALTAIDAGRTKVSARCNNTWNSQWWVDLTKVAKPFAEYLLSQLDPNAERVPTQSQINELFTALQPLITDNSHHKTGDCGSTEKDEPLLSGSKTYTLKPNNPIRVSLYTGYYLYTRGYGCWKAQAGVASDYYLLGVVESQITTDPECCVDKYANYIAGSVSSPSDAVYDLYAVNSLANRLQKVGFHLALFGDWDGLNSIPGSGIIILSHEYDNNLAGRSCLVGDQVSILNGSRGMMRQVTGIGSIAVYPNPAHDVLNIDFNLHEKTDSEISLVNLSTGVTDILHTGEQTEGINALQFPLQNRAKGIYMIKCRLKENVFSFKVIIL